MFLGKSYGMKKQLVFIAFLISLSAIVAHSQIPAIDIHSHIMTDEYLNYLSDNNALMEDGYPLPSWDEKSHLAFMDSTGIDRSGRHSASVKDTSQPGVS